MDLLSSLSTILKDIIKDVDNVKTKQTFILEHIKNVTKTNLISFELPRGQDWFNVSEPLTESMLRGKVVVLDFFTYCCINCLHVLPHLRALEENFSVADGLVVIGVHSAKFENEKNSKNIAHALKRYNITHPVLNDSEGLLWNKMNISCWPTIVIISPTSQPLFVLVGEGCKEELFLYVQSTINYFKKDILSHFIPINRNASVIKSSALSFPSKIVRFENIFAISDSGNHRILVINKEGEILYKVGGGSSGLIDGSFEVAKFNSPQGLAFGKSKNEIYVADTENHCIRLIDLTKKTVTTIAGTGKQGFDFVGGKHGTIQEISSPWDLCFVSFPSDTDRRVSSNPNSSISIESPTNVSSDNFHSPSPSTRPSTSAPFAPPPPPPPPPRLSLISDEQILRENRVFPKNILFIAMSGIHQIWALFLEDTIWWKGKKYKKYECAAIAGSGKEENRNNQYPMMACFAQPSGLCYNLNEKALYIADSESSSIRKLSLEDGSVSHIVGGDKNPADLFNFGDQDGKGYLAKLQHPLGVTYSSQKDMIYVCDTYNHKIKSIDVSTSECKSLHTTKNLFDEPSGCCLDETGNILYVTDTNNNAIATFDLVWETKEVVHISEGKEAGVRYAVEKTSWDETIEVTTKEGLIIILIELIGKDVRGVWRFDKGESDVTVDQSNGEVSSSPMVLRLKVPPSDSENISTANIYFDLTFCEEEMCRFKKCAMKLKIKRTKTGEEVIRTEFRKSLS